MRCTQLHIVTYCLLIHCEWISCLYSDKSTFGIFFDASSEWWISCYILFVKCSIVCPSYFILDRHRNDSLL